MSTRTFPAAGSLAVNSGPMWLLPPGIASFFVHGITSFLPTGLLYFFPQGLHHLGISMIPQRMSTTNWTFCKFCPKYINPIALLTNSKHRKGKILENFQWWPQAHETQQWINALRSWWRTACPWNQITVEQILWKVCRFI